MSMRAAGHVIRCMPRALLGLLVRHVYATCLGEWSMCISDADAKLSLLADAAAQLRRTGRAGKLWRPWMCQPSGRGYVPRTCPAFLRVPRVDRIRFPRGLGLLLRRGGNIRMQCFTPKASSTTERTLRSLASVATAPATQRLRVSAARVRLHQIVAGAYPVNSWAICCHCRRRITWVALDTARARPPLSWPFAALKEEPERRIRRADEPTLNVE